MELMQLQMLVAAAEEGSLQRAAERVHRTPQAVSIALGKLEKEIGIPLFERAPGRVFAPTPAGEVLVEYARRALSLLGEALEAVGEIRSVKRGRLRAGANQSIGESVLPQLTDAFRKKYPAVQLKVVIGYSEFVLAALARHELDIALVASRPREKNLRGRLMMTDRLVAVMSPRHRLANRAAIPLAELGGESLILLTETSELRERVVETFHRFGIPMNLRVETGTLESVKRMAAQDMGVGIVPRLCVRKEEAASSLRVKTIEGFGEDRALWIVHPRLPSPASEAFMAVIETELAARANGGGRGP